MADTHAGVPDASKLDRVLQAAVVLNLLGLGPEDKHKGIAATYQNTALSAVLRDGEPNSMRSVMRMTMELCYAPYSQFVAGALLLEDNRG